MGTAVGEHPPGMTSRCISFSRTALLALSCSISPGCDAPEKTVGQESGTETETETDATNCGSVLPCETGTTGGDSETDTSTPENCANFSNATDCTNQGCGWLDVAVTSSDGATCDVSEGGGYCFDGDDSETAGGCQVEACDGEGGEFWTREIDDGTWEVARRDCFSPIPGGFSLCEYDGNDPAACDCACSDSAPSLPSDFEETLGASGCADMVVYGATPDGSIGVVLYTGPDFNPVADAVAAGETVTTTHDVSEFARVSVLVGDNVTYLECNDAIDESAYSIDQEWLAVAGEVEIEIVPDPAAEKFGTQGVATVTITGLEVTFSDVSHALNTVVFADVPVGWLPG